MSAIADRIAGRDLDREAVADALDEDLEHFGLLFRYVPDMADGAELFSVPTFDALPDNRADDPEWSGGFWPQTTWSDCEYVAPREMVVGANWSTFVHLRTEVGPFRMLVRKIALPLGQRAILDGKALPQPATNGYWILSESTEFYEGGYNKPVREFTWVTRDRVATWTGNHIGVRRGALVTMKWWNGRDWIRNRKVSTPMMGSWWSACCASRPAIRRYEWGLTIGHPGFPGAYLPTTPEAARALFADRNVVGGKRRTALRHWVKEHYRRGHTPEESHKVREHLRGIERFQWHGLDVKLQVPSAEIEAAGLLARGRAA